MNNFIEMGIRRDWTNTTGATVNSGQAVAIATGSASMGVLGVAVDTIAPGATGAVQIQGVVSLPALSTDVWAEMAIIYWNVPPAN